MRDSVTILHPFSLILCCRAPRLAASCLLTRFVPFSFHGVVLREPARAHLQGRAGVCVCVPWPAFSLASPPQPAARHRDSLHFRAKVNTLLPRFSFTYSMSIAKTQRATCSSSPRPSPPPRCHQPPPTLSSHPLSQILQKLWRCNCAVLPQRQGAAAFTRPPPCPSPRPFLRCSAFCTRWIS